MNLSGIPNDSFVGRLLRWPLKLIPPNAVVPVLQGRLRGTRWIVGSSTHGCWLGSYEFEKRTLFEQTIKPGDVVYDVGANVGFYTLLACRLTGSAGRVIAFEPLPMNLQFLWRHLQLNKVSNAIVIDAAVSRSDGNAQFQEKSSATGRLSESGKLVVRTVAIDDLVLRKEIPPPDCVKMDIEGGEVAALQGMPEVLRRFKPTIFLATHGEDLTRKCLELLLGCGYSFKALDGKALLESGEILAALPSWGGQSAQRLQGGLDSTL